MSDFLIPFRLLPHIVLFNKNHVCDFIEKASIFYLLSKIIIEISFSTITSQKSRQVLLKKGKKYIYITGEIHRQCYMLIQQCLSCFWKENSANTNDWGKMHAFVTRTLLFEQLIIINHLQKNLKACCMPFYVLTTKCRAEERNQKRGELETFNSSCNHNYLLIH